MKKRYNLCEGCRKDVECSECEVFHSKEKMKYIKRLLGW